MAVPAPVANAGHKLTIPYFDGINPAAGAALSFLEKLESYRVMVGYEEGNKVQLLQHALIDHALVWFNNEADTTPNIKRDWDTFERLFKEHYQTTMTISATLSARANVKQARNETVSNFYERCRHIVRLTHRPFTSTRPEAIRDHEAYVFAIADYKEHVNGSDRLAMFVQGLLPEIRRLILHQTFQTPSDVRDLALNAERGLMNDGFLKDPNTAAFSGRTDTRSGITVYGAGAGGAGRNAHAMQAFPGPGMQGHEYDADAGADLHAVGARGGSRGRSGTRGRGRGRGSAQRPRPQCRHCKQVGHEEPTCWAKYPHLKPVRTARQVNVVEVNPPAYEVSNLEAHPVFEEPDFHF